MYTAIATVQDLVATVLISHRHCIHATLCAEDLCNEGFSVSSGEAFDCASDPAGPARHPSPAASPKKQAHAPGIWHRRLENLLPHLGRHHPATPTTQPELQPAAILRTPNTRHPTADTRHPTADARHSTADIDTHQSTDRRDTGPARTSEDPYATAERRARAHATGNADHDPNSAAQCTDPPYTLLNTFPHAAAVLGAAVRNRATPQAAAAAAGTWQDAFQEAQQSELRTARSEHTGRAQRAQRAQRGQRAQRAERLPSVGVEASFSRRMSRDPSAIESDGASSATPAFLPRRKSHAAALTSNGSVPRGFAACAVPFCTVPV